MTSRPVTVRGIFAADGELKDIPGYEGLFAATKDGYIWSFPKGTSNPKGRFLKAHGTGKNRLTVVLTKNKIRRGWRIHRLIAITFIPNPQHLPWINHKNGNPMDNYVENLEWCTPQFNNLHALQTGLRKLPSGSEHWSRRLSVKRNRKGQYAI